MDIRYQRTTVIYRDSGPFACEEPYEFQIDDIDVDSFRYWDNKVSQ